MLILGDTNSALSAIVSARRDILECHMEAGNRRYDDRVPEEVNRRIIDHASTLIRGEDELVVLLWANEMFDRANPDIVTYNL